ncbi:hypothetical protein BUALT_Bualt02G0038700 [Buddleja alternifolia]|uniref:U4/U6.U5 tri-snRNP-associated protein 2 n=1 Tax=Buddleja alternifolia TaxID=168488 RepID=A0AAV6XX51_9LAMI|nr:hypothetical protein BUALT_Bualt02G0038700 [Buddleja alternifolia]
MEQNRKRSRRRCPYLDSVDRTVLDFDLEKRCSVFGSNFNVYACLVCGKYYHGGGQRSYAYTHSILAGHRVYINLETEKFYCLPDGYEVIDPSLDDIRHVLNPRFAREQVSQLDTNRQWSRALDGSCYLPGMVGLNTMAETDFVNVTIQSLMRVTPLRNFFLVPKNYQLCKSQLVHRFGELTRKIWHAGNFKGQVSPHEFLQAVMEASEKRFRISAKSDPVEFMSWLLNTLHGDLKSSQMGRSIIHQCFQVPLLNILQKFNGETVTEVVDSHFARMRYRVTRLTQYLILHMRRFSSNNFFVEKNPTLVNFPVRNLELRDYIPLPEHNANERVRSRYQMQDLHVTQTLPQVAALSETYMLIYDQQQQ